MQKLALVLSVLMMLGCHSNPYSGIDDTLSKTPPVATKPTQNGGCSVQGVVDVTEGASTPVNITCVVPNGTPSVSFNNLPAFATWDAAKAVLTVTPQAGDGNDPSTPNSTTRTYPVQVNLSMANEPVAVSSNNFVIVVHHKAATAQIQGFDANATIREGNSYYSNFSVTSADFPQGPFTISAVNLPPGVTITQNSPTTFSLNYTPDYKTVNINTYTGNCTTSALCKGFQWQLNVIDPRGMMTSASALWQVLDVRLNPIVIFPSGLSGTVPAVSFEVQAEDPNGETQPSIELENISSGSASLNVMDYGNGNSTQNPYSFVQANWTGVPTSAKGKVQTMTIRTCVYSDYYSQDQCVNTNIEVQF